MNSINQRDIRVTPMQTALIGTAIASDGAVMGSYIVKQTLTSDLDVISTTKPKEFGRTMLKTTAKRMQETMVADVEPGAGHRVATPDAKVAGRTGIAEIDTSTPPYMWFMGFAPADDPKIAVIMVAESSGNVGWNGNGSSAAVPVAKKVLQAYLGSS